MFYWVLKNTVILLLIFACFYVAWADQRVFNTLQSWIGRFVILVGGSINVMHYMILKRSTRSFDKPERLVDSKGLFGKVRHPMYLGDALMMLGFSLLYAHWQGWLVGLFGWFFVWLLAKEEDHQMAAWFPQEHDAWRRRTGLVFPKW